VIREWKSISEVETRGTVEVGTDIAGLECHAGLGSKRLLSAVRGLRSETPVAGVARPI
jgi:hypothetical protein